MIICCSACTWRNVSSSNKTRRNCKGLKITVCVHNWGTWRVWLCARSLGWAWLFESPCIIAQRASLSVGFSRQNKEMGCHFPLQIYGRQDTTKPKKPNCHFWRIRAGYCACPLHTTPSIQFSHSTVSDSLWAHGLQHVRLPCPSLSPRVCSNSCPLSQWCIQPSHPLSPPSPPALSISQNQGLFLWVISWHQEAKAGASASASVLLVNVQDWFHLSHPSGLTPGPALPLTPHRKPARSLLRKQARGHITCSRSLLLRQEPQ